MSRACRRWWPRSVIRNRSREGVPPFSYRKAGEDTIDGRRVWRIDFVESVLPPLIKTPGGAHQLSRGTMWVDPEDGAVSRTTLNLAIDTSREKSRAQLAVDFRRDEGVGFLVPAEMRKFYIRGATRIDGLAKYSNFRQFRTSGRIIEK